MGIIFLVLVIMVMIAFSEIGFAALLVLPLTGIAVWGLFCFLAMLGGFAGAAQQFFICAAIVGGAFGIIYLISGSEPK